MEESDFEESDFEESKEFKNFYEVIKKKYNTDKDTKTKYNSNGFDKDGKHKDTKTKYDSNGFDKDGKHKDTKTKYDSSGFDKDGKYKDTKTKYDSNGFDKDGTYKDSKTKYDSNGFDKDGKHKDTGIFLNKKNINWLKNKDEFLKLYNEIIKNGEFSENINKKNISSYEFKKIMENILNWKVDDNKMIKK